MLTRSRLSKMRWLTFVVGLLASIALVFGSVGSATTSVAAGSVPGDVTVSQTMPQAGNFVAPSGVVAPSVLPAASPSDPDITFKASGKYLKKVANYKVRLYIPQSKPKGTDLGVTKIIDTRGGSRFVFTAKYEKVNNYRVRVTLSETGYDIFETYLRSPASRSEVGAWAVRLNKTWRYLDYTDPKLIYPSVAGKAFYVQGRLWYERSQYRYVHGKWQWVVTRQGYDNLPRVNILSVTRVK